MADDVAPAQAPARHFSITEKMRWLEPNPNLPPHLRTIPALFKSLADQLLIQIDDSPQLALALQHLIDGKDCAVRARIDNNPPPSRPIRDNPQA